MNTTKLIQRLNEPRYHMFFNRMLCTGRKDIEGNKIEYFAGCYSYMDGKSGQISSHGHTYLLHRQLMKELNNGEPFGLELLPVYPEVRASELYDEMIENLESLTELNKMVREYDNLKNDPICERVCKTYKKSCDAYYNYVLGDEYLEHLKISPIEFQKFRSRK